MSAHLTSSMYSVCKWLGFYLCMKEPSAVAEKHGLTGIHGGHYKCDMLITLRGFVAMETMLPS